MGKVTLLVFAVVSIVATVYAQPAQEPALSSSAVVLPASYHMGMLQSDKDSLIFPSAFLKNVNGAKNTPPKEQNTPVNKIGVGAMNAATSWTEVPKQMGEVSAKYNPLLGATVGLGEGLVKGLARGASGIVDMATFSLPPYNKPLMQPAYQVAKPDDGFKVNLLDW